MCELMSSEVAHSSTIQSVIARTVIHNSLQFLVHHMLQSSDSLCCKAQPDGAAKHNLIVLQSTMCGKAQPDCAAKLNLIVLESTVSQT